MKEKIEQIIESEGLTPSKFADLIEVQRSNISHILAGRNKPSLDFIYKILNTFPAISAEWLLSDNGPMYKDGTERVVAEQPSKENMGLFTLKSEDAPEYKARSVQPAPSGNQAKPVQSGNKKKIKKIVVIYDDFEMDEFILKQKD